MAGKNTGKTTGKTQPTMQEDDFSGTITKKVTIRAREGASPIETTLTVDFRKASLEVVCALAMKSLIISWQGKARAKGANFVNSLAGKSYTYTLSQLIQILDEKKPSSNSRAAIQTDVLDTLLAEGAITREVYDAKVAALKAQLNK